MSIVKTLLVGAAALLMVGQVGLAKGTATKHTKHTTVASATANHKHAKVAKAHKRGHRRHKAASTRTASHRVKAHSAGARA
jgi:hypothetical protein